MYTIDIHSNKETIDAAFYNLDIGIKIARQNKEKILCVITGYGSHNTKHKIKSAIILKLEEYVNKKYVKGYILGNEVDIFNARYQSFPNKEKLGKEEFINKNPGVIYVAL